MRTLEVGAGLGEHIRFVDLETQEYHAIELRESMVEVIYRDYPHVSASIGDCEKRLPYPDNYFDRVIAIHLLAHLYNLPAALVTFFPLRVPIIHLNLVIGITATLLPESSSARRRPGARDREG
jgi:ubiquinone/menaquinone biosynthesis C-methylase UbiE